MRKPGLETRLIPAMVRVRSPEYFRVISRVVPGLPTLGSTVKPAMKPSRSRTEASDSLSFEPGMRTVSNMAELALRIRVSMSAMGSVIVMAAYQLAFVTPGTSPACTMTRKQMRQSPNLRYTAFGRPHRWHRVYPRTLNLGVRCCFSIRAFFAIVLPVLLSERKAERCQERPSFLVRPRGREDGDVHA